MTDPIPPADDFAEALAVATATPGGGAAAARAGQLATALLRMVTGISLEKAPKDEEGENAATWTEVRSITDRAVELSERFRTLESADMAAFEGFLDALRLPKGTDEEKAVRRTAMRDATVTATEVPLDTLEASVDVLVLARELYDVASKVRLRAEADLGGAVELAHAAFRGAELNVRVNLPGLKNDDRLAGLEARWDKLNAVFESRYQSLRADVIEWLES